jgi:hypothetical protein
VLASGGGGAEFSDGLSPQEAVDQRVNDNSPMFQLVLETDIAKKYRQTPKPRIDG